MKIVGATGLVGLWALEWAWEFLLDQLIGINETNTFRLKFLLIIKTERATVLGGLLALERAWLTDEKKFALRRNR